VQRKKERKIENKGVFVRFKRVLGRMWGNVRGNGRKWLKMAKNRSLNFDCFGGKIIVLIINEIEKIVKNN